jgi:hypothetical protein
MQLLIKIAALVLVALVTYWAMAGTAELKIKRRRRNFND